MDDYVGTSEIEIPEFRSNIAGRRIYNPENLFPPCSRPSVARQSCSQLSCSEPLVVPQSEPLVVPLVVPQSCFQPFGAQPSSQMIDPKVLDALKSTPDITA